MTERILQLFHFRESRTQLFSFAKQRSPNSGAGSGPWVIWYPARKDRIKRLHCFVYLLCEIEQCFISKNYPILFGSGARQKGQIRNDHRGPGPRLLSRVTRLSCRCCPSVLRHSFNPVLPSLPLRIECSPIICFSFLCLVLSLERWKKVWNLSHIPNNYYHRKRS